MGFDIELTLRGDTVEATAAGITLHDNDSQTVAGVFADTFERCQGAGVDDSLKFFDLTTDDLLFLLGLGYDFLKLVFLLLQNVGVVVEFIGSSADILGFLLNFSLSLADMLLGEFDFEILILFLFLKE